MNFLQVSELFKKLAGHFLLPVLVMYIRLTVQAPEDHYHNIVLTGVLRCPMLFTNLFSASCLRKRGWYLHGATKTPNRCDDFQLAFTPIQNGLYVLQTLHTTPTAAVIQTSLVLSVRILQRNTSAPLTVSQPERPFATLSPK